ncbi:T9SS type A sorting domain-containing protein, partial [Chryseobacterium sp.]|uniref:T9SS type A sorting domain-containing protein n=1 Tax=Chryseobacterium sp. TaxID=1871047 RepID=UPI0025C49484
RTLFVILSLTSVLSVSAQVLETENYNSYTIGNVSTDITGATPGQGNIYVKGEAASDFQIVNGDATHVKYLQVTTGSAAATTSDRSAYKIGLETAWAGRTSGNNIIKGTADIFTGASAGTQNSGVCIYGRNNAGNIVPLVGVRYNSSTNRLDGLAYLRNNSNNSLDTYDISYNNGATYPANTWVTVNYSYNTTTGAITYKMGNEASVTLSVSGMSTVPGLVPVEHVVFSSLKTYTAIATVFGIDNYRVEASNNTNAILAVKESTINENEISLFPNPASDILTIKSPSKIESIEVYDIEGRKIDKNLDNSGQIKIQDLSSGTYILSVETKEGKVSKKFIKK